MKQSSDWPIQAVGVPADTPFRLRVEADGHQNYQETLVLSHGQELTKSIRLEPLRVSPLGTGKTERRFQ